MRRPTMDEHQSQRFLKGASSERKRIRTRAMLMDAAVRVISARGIEATTVSDIIAASAVSQGTFYYHFENKQKIVEAAGRAVATALVDQTDSELAGMSRGLERLALGTAVFVTLATQDEDWGRLVTAALLEVGPLQDGISRGIRKDVTLAIDEGDISGPISGLAFQSALAVVATAIRSCLSSREQTSEIRLEASALVLRLLGVDPLYAAMLPGKVWQDYMAQRGRPPLLSLPRYPDADVETVDPAA